jgi:type II secretory pathway pseudopilin PulG
MDCKITSFNNEARVNAAKRRRNSSRAFTIVELMISLGIGVILVAQACALWFYSTRSFAAQVAYTSLDQDSQRALDQLSRDVRQATNMVSFATNEIVLKTLAGQNLAFGLTNKSFVRVVGASRYVLLKNCDWLNFKMYQRTPVSGSYDPYPSTNLATCKLIEVNWKCSRRPFPTSAETTEYMQSAKVVLRSKL